ncbi:amino acid ABC transporter permease [Paraburkholderia sp. J10-1]|uniref:amino acid ABC transporter permease n=1 Tax=Paraburkholderia sp. J10-1 TaxID=2805430 RepID=UPI002AB73073|nr:amino acid ABC transporter permease [Paraburkholderia sp. J10-1]
MDAYHWDFSFLAGYNNALLQGAAHTAYLSLTIMFFGMVIGGVFAGLASSNTTILRNISKLYVELFRNVPALVMLFWFFYAIPIMTGIQNSRLLAASIAFSLYTGAYFCEIFRSGLQSIPRGQWEAARALGFSRKSMFITVIFPQMIKRILPSLTNEIVEVVKISAVAATIAYPELLYQAQLISDTEYRPVEAYTAIALIMTAGIMALSGVSHYVEYRMKRSD